MQKRRQGRFVVKSKRGRGKSITFGEEIKWKKEGGWGGVSGKNKNQTGGNSHGPS